VEYGFSRTYTVKRRELAGISLALKKMGLLEPLVSNGVDPRISTTTLPILVHCILV
jgi:hypothetical protein